jgi:hypothetical protein
MMLFLNDKVPTARLALSNARAFCCTRGRGCNAQPGFPAPLCSFEGKSSCITRADRAAGTRRHDLRRNDGRAV